MDPTMRKQFKDAEKRLEKKALVTNILEQLRETRLVPIRYLDATNIRFDSARENGPINLRARIIYIVLEYGDKRTPMFLEIFFGEYSNVCCNSMESFARVISENEIDGIIYLDITERSMLSRMAKF